MEYDIAIIGAGPAGLAAAIRCKQLKPELRVCILEKGASIGAHVLSGSAFDPRALNHLFPDWKERGAPVRQPAMQDRFLWLTKRHAVSLPVPPSMDNKGCYVISLSELCRWLGAQAEALGVDVFPGFPAAEVIIESGQVCGVITGDLGRAKDGAEKPNFQPGVAIRATHTLFAEGCRGSLSEQIIRAFNLRAKADPQTYGIGIKEIWEVEAAKHRPGEVVHSVGWPLNAGTYGGAFVYHMENRQVAIGFITGLDYKNPYLDPYQEFQRFKTHPSIRPLLEGGKRLEYGARALNEGGLQSIPGLTFPGGALIGCSAGFLNVARIKGSHNALESGMLAAEAIAAGDLAQYPVRLRASPLYKELHAARNLRPAFHKWGLWGGLAYSALDQYVLRGRAPWTLRTRTADHASLKPAAKCRPIAYPAPDGVVTFDRMSSVFISNTHHEENQPCHLRLRHADIPIQQNLPLYAAPEQRYCPAGVYEIIQDTGGARLQINAANCVHCKTCDIKDPTQNIVWIPPEGGGGPNYRMM